MVNVASGSGHVDAVKLLLENGADISVPNNQGLVPLHTASSRGYLDIVKLLR